MLFQLKLGNEILKLDIFVAIGNVNMNVEISKKYPSRDFSPNLNQDLSGLSGFFRQLRSKSCFKMSGLSGFRTVYLKKPLKSCAVFEQFF